MWSNLKLKNTYIVENDCHLKFGPLLNLKHSRFKDIYIDLIIIVFDIWPNPTIEKKTFFKTYLNCWSNCCVSKFGSILSFNNTFKSHLKCWHHYCVFKFGIGPNFKTQ